MCQDKALDCLEFVMNKCVSPSTALCGLFMRLAGPAFVIAFYYLMCYHTWIFLTIIATVLRSRVGTNFAIVWTLIGIVITYNVVWNHLLAMLLKPGSPKDLIVSLSVCLFEHIRFLFAWMQYTNPLDYSLVCL